jgi:hypothetical protein
VHYRSLHALYFVCGHISLLSSQSLVDNGSVSAGTHDCPFQVIFMSLAWHILKGPVQRKLSPPLAMMFVIPSIL